MESECVCVCVREHVRVCRERWIVCTNARACSAYPCVSLLLRKAGMNGSEGWKRREGKGRMEGKDGRQGWKAMFMLLLAWSERPKAGRRGDLQM